MNVLSCLVAADGEPVSRNDLFDAVWPRAEVTDDTLTKCIVELRKALGDTARDSRVIETIPKLGFRLVLPAVPLTPEQASAETQGYRRGMRRIVSLRLFIVPILVCVALLGFGSSRAWLTEAGITLFLKTAAILVPYSLEQQSGIAVLPFVNMSDDAGNEYFSDGISAELINALASSNRLPVTARNSSFQFKGQNKDIKEIGRLLGVTYVLEGSVRREDQSVRVTTQLIDTATGMHVWSGVYQRELGDIFDLQNEIASSIVNQIDHTLASNAVPLPDSSPVAGIMAVRHTANFEAYDLYLKGMQMLRSTNPLLIEQASDYFDAAIALDMDYADAWAAKGVALYVQGRPGYGHLQIPATVYPGAIAAFRKALEIEPGHTLATGWLGVTLMVAEYQWAEGMELIRQSLAVNPNDAELLSVYALHLAMMNLEGADEVLYRAFRLDPFGSIPIIIRAGFLLRENRVLDAAAMLEISLMQDRDGYAPNFHSAALNIMIGRLDAAQERIQKAREVAHADDLSLDALEWVINYRRGGSLPPVWETLERMQTERLSFFEQRDRFVEWEDERVIVAAFDLGIKQRHPEMRAILHGPKPPELPELEWRRMKDITGVTRFQAGLQERRGDVY
ncbi:MAG: winged helix-turn-helix domain-containing protein [Halioglobus sp.]|nr:winged helix-turn-helix domain-containing protein [Halioglobus sp.]